MLEKQDTKIKSHLAVQRAADELRRQLGVVIRDKDGKSYAFCPAEFVSSMDYAQLQPYAHLLLTASRMRSLPQGTDAASSIALAPLSYEQMQALADPVISIDSYPVIAAVGASDLQQKALMLAKEAAVLPAMIAAPLDSLPAGSCDGWLHLTAEEIHTALREPLLDVMEMAHARLPTDVMEDGRLISFRARLGTAVHLALVTGDVSGDTVPLVRVHSSCVTGDILGSLRCDCGDQLQMALSQIAESKCGILLYLHQEGRGIGINNKLRAYALQERGFDTYDANLMLGYDEDERDFSIAAAMLRRLGVRKLRLLTNNPHKLEDMRRLGCDVTERVAVVAQAGRHNHAYLEAKVQKSGHLL